MDNVFLGPQHSAINLPYLTQTSIHSIVLAGLHLKERFPHAISYLPIAIDDDPTSNIAPRLNPVIDWIKAQDKNVLVHCVSGVSRSATFVIAYLIRAKKMRYKEPYMHII